MKRMLGCLMMLCAMGFVHSFAATKTKPKSTPTPLPCCTVQMVEAGVPQCDPQGPESGAAAKANPDDVDAADCKVEGECQGTATGNTEGEGPFDGSGDDTAPDHG